MRTTIKSFFAALTRNAISLTGTAITTATAILFLTFFSLDLLGMQGHPYMGILAYLVVPMVFVIGLVLIPIGIRRERRRALAGTEAQLPVLDFNVDRTRNRFLVFLGLTIANLVILAVASYKGVEVMDSTPFCGQACHSVMQPEFAGHQRGAHASVGCVDCHIGPGAGWFVKSKLSGSWQVISVNLKLYPRPIPTPVHNLRPARETCEQCHWPSKFVGDRLKVVTTFTDDETAKEQKTVLLLRVGGIQGRASHGIHWHVDPQNQIRYRSNDNREEIYEVELTGADGKPESFVAADAKPGQGTWRVMDCVDCHNRPAHTFHSPEEEVDSALADGKLDRTLPYVRRQAVAAIKTAYPSHEEAQTGIRSALQAFYQKDYPAVAKERAAAIDGAAAALFEAYKANVFPTMNVSWGTYPVHIGHQVGPGCWRCHDDAHKSASGKTISQDCDTCHSLLAEQEENPKVLQELNP